MEPERFAADTVPSLLRMLCEQLAVQFRIAQGPARLELLFNDGALLDVHVHKKVKATSLAPYEDGED